MKEKHSAPGQIQEGERERERQWNPRDGSYHSTPLLFHWGAATTTTTTDAASSFLESKELCKYDLLTAEKRLQSLFLSLSYFNCFFLSH